MSRAQVHSRYPADHVFRPSADVYPDLHRLNFPRGDWTDDTDQMLLILQTLLECNGHYDGPVFSSKLTDWKNHGFPTLGDQGGAGLGRTTASVMAHKNFASHPDQAASAVWERSGRKVAPNGAVMRTAITGVPFFWDRKAVQDNTLAFCRATHADPRCAASCIVVAECVRQILELGTAIDSSSGEAIIASAIEEGVRVAELSTEAEAELRSYAVAQPLDSLKLDDSNAIGYTFKTMGAGLWALRASTAHEDDVQMQPSDIFAEIARAGGDADTNGAVAGALVGVAAGFCGLPQSYIGEMPYGAWLEAWVQKVLFMMQLPVSGVSTH